MGKVEIQLKKNGIEASKSMLVPIEDRIEHALTDIMARKEKFQLALSAREK